VRLRIPFGAARKCSPPKRRAPDRRSMRGGRSCPDTPRGTRLRRRVCVCVLAAASAWGAGTGLKAGGILGVLNAMHREDPPTLSIHEEATISTNGAMMPATTTSSIPPGTGERGDPHRRAGRDVGVAGGRQGACHHAPLSFLGLGVPEPYPSWGRMLSVSAAAFALRAAWVVIFPGLTISHVVFASNLWGMGCGISWILGSASDRADHRVPRARRPPAIV
jgi:hypothetical protein